jgi:hypothetical protein
MRGLQLHATAQANLQRLNTGRGLFLRGHSGPFIFHAVDSLFSASRFPAASFFIFM